jgi:hypothetical protein
VRKKPDLCIPGQSIGEFVQTIAAESVKTSGLSVYSAVKCLLGLGEHIIHAVKLQICHTTAVRADKMTVTGSIRVKMVNAVAYLQALYFSSVGEKRQIAVDGSQTDIRIFLPDVLIHNVGGGMILAGHQKAMDKLPLPTVFHRHGNSS